MANTHSLDLEVDSSQYAYITNANQTGLGFTTGVFTVGCWIKLETTGIGQGIISKRNGDTSGYSLYVGSDNQLYFDCRGGGNSDTAISTSTILGSTWTHVTGLRNGSNLLVYINAIDVTSGSVTDNTRDVSNTSPFALGLYSTSTPDAYFDGKIDEVRIWNDVRTTQEISDN